jgi:hypothetical protein
LLLQVAFHPRHRCRVAVGRRRPRDARPRGWPTARLARFGAAHTPPCRRRAAQALARRGPGPERRAHRVRRSADLELTVGAGGDHGARPLLHLALALCAQREHPRRRVHHKRAIAAARVLDRRAAQLDGPRRRLAAVRLGLVLVVSERRLPASATDDTLAGDRGGSEHPPQTQRCSAGVWTVRRRCGGRTRTRTRGAERARCVRGAGSDAAPTRVGGDACGELTPRR